MRATLGREAITHINEQARDYYVEIYGRLLELLKTNKNIKFTVNVRGAIGDKDVSGALQFDKQKRTLLTVPSRLAYLDNQIIKDLDGSTPNLFQKVPYYVVGEDTFVMGFKEYVVGDKKAQFVTERRQQPFFAGFEAARAASAFSEEEMTTLRSILELRNSNPEVFIQMVEAVCYKYMPDYYSELKQIEEKYRERQNKAPHTSD
jgi:hypothetical protein